MSSLEPPTRPYASATPSLAAPSLATSSTTHIGLTDMQETGELGGGEEHPLATLGAGASQETSAPEAEIKPTQQPYPPAEPIASQTSEKPTVDSQEVPQTPQTHLTFLVISGRRRTMAFEPDTTVGRVKELVWNAWPAGECKPLFYLALALINCAL